MGLTKTCQDKTRGFPVQTGNSLISNLFSPILSQSCSHSNRLDPFYPVDTQSLQSMKIKFGGSGGEPQLAARCCKIPRTMKNEMQIENAQTPGSQQVFGLEVGCNRSIWALIAFEHDNFSRHDELEGCRIFVTR